MSGAQDKMVRGKFKDEGLCLGDGDTSPRIGFRFRRDGGDVWFSLYAGNHKLALFAGLVNKGWPAQLRALADFVEQRLKEAERLGDGK